MTTHKRRAMSSQVEAVGRELTRYGLVDRIRSTAVAAIFLRLALAAGFLSAVADRFGLWGPPGTPGVAWGGFDPFLAYIGKLLWYLPPALVPAVGWAATVLEVVLAVGLVAGVRLWAVALASGVLLSVFAATMTVAFGPERMPKIGVLGAAIAFG